MRVLIGRLNQWLNNMHPTLARPHSPAVSAAQRDVVSGISCISCNSLCALTLTGWSHSGGAGIRWWYSQRTRVSYGEPHGATRECCSRGARHHLERSSTWVALALQTETTLRASSSRVRVPSAASSGGRFGGGAAGAQRWRRWVAG
jgi:hypothetical protein